MQRYNIELDWDELIIEADNDGEWIRYKDVEKRLYLLNCIEGAGVDNWSGYDGAMEYYEEKYPEENY